MVWSSVVIKNWTHCMKGNSFISRFFDIKVRPLASFHVQFPKIVEIFSTWIDTSKNEHVFSTNTSWVISSKLNWKWSRSSFPGLPCLLFTVKNPHIVKTISSFSLNIKLFFTTKNDQFVSFKWHTAMSKSSKVGRTVKIIHSNPVSCTWI